MTKNRQFLPPCHGSFPKSEAKWLQDIYRGTRYNDLGRCLLSRNLLRTWNFLLEQNPNIIYWWYCGSGAWISLQGLPPPKMLFYGDDENRRSFQTFVPWFGGRKPQCQPGDVQLLSDAEIYCYWIECLTHHLEFCVDSVSVANINASFIYLPKLGQSLYLSCLEF